MCQLYFFVEKAYQKHMIVFICGKDLNPYIMSNFSISPKSCLVGSFTATASAQTYSSASHTPAAPLGGDTT